MVSIIIVDIINLIFIAKSLYFAGIFSLVGTCAACTAIYGKFEREEDPILSDPSLVVVISITGAIIFNIILVGSLKLPIIVLLSVLSCILNIIIGALLIYYYTKITLVS